jgi:hypothetical protein
MFYHSTLLLLLLFLLQLSLLAGHVPPMVSLGSGFGCHGSGSPIPAACGGKHCETTARVRCNDHLFMFYHAKHVVLQQAAIPPISGACRGKHCETTARVHNIVHLFIFYCAKCVRFIAGGRPPHPWCSKLQSDYPGVPHSPFIYVLFC